MTDDCDALEARSAMLHREARLGLETALDHGPAWPGYREQIEIANQVDALAEQVDAKIEEDC